MSCFVLRHKLIQQLLFVTEPLNVLGENVLVCCDKYCFFAEQYAVFLAARERLARLRPHTLRAYRSELTAAAAALTAPRDVLTRHDLETWVSWGNVSASTVAPPTPTPAPDDLLTSVPCILYDNAPAPTMPQP